MIKRIIYFIISIVVLFLLSYPLHQYILQVNQVELSFSLFSIYLFHIISGILIYACIEGIASFFPNEAGYGYLAAVFIKLGFFVLIFKDPVFTNDTLSKPERFSLVIPLFIFLIAEAIATAKLLNSK